MIHIDSLYNAVASYKQLHIWVSISKLERRNKFWLVASSPLYRYTFESHMGHNNIKPIRYIS